MCRYRWEWMCFWARMGIFGSHVITFHIIIIAMRDMLHEGSIPAEWKLQEDIMDSDVSILKIVLCVIE